MAEVRLEHEWLRAAVPAAWVINRNGWTKEPVDPLRIIPPPFRPEPEPPPPKTAEQVAFENRLGWGALDRFFGGL